MNLHHLFGLDLLSAALIIYDLSIFASGFFNNLIQWYISSLIQGISSSFLLYVPLSYIINAWYIERKGFAFGISAMSAGLVGILANIFGGLIIHSIGWRNSYFVVSIISLVMALPATLLILRRNPHEKGCLPYGYKKESKIEATVSSHDIDKNKFSKQELLIIFCLILVSGIYGFSTSYTQHLTNYAISIGQVAMTGVYFTSFAMIGNVFGKFFIGMLNDRIGVTNASRIGVTIVMISFLIFMKSSIPIPLFFVSSIFSGLSMALLAVQTPLLASSVIIKEKYDQVFAYVTIASTLVSSVGTSIIGSIFSISKSYQICFLLGMIIMVICIILQSYMFKKANVDSILTRSKQKDSAP